MGKHDGHQWHRVEWPASRLVCCPGQVFSFDKNPSTCHYSRQCKQYQSWLDRVRVDCAALWSALLCPSQLPKMQLLFHLLSPKRYFNAELVELNKRLKLMNYIFRFLSSALFSLIWSLGSSTST